MSRIHKDCAAQPQEPVQFSCQLCDFVATCTDDVFFKHLRSTHLKVHHKVICPFNGCNFESNVYSTFNAHKSREHKEHDWRMFKAEIISSNNDNVNIGDSMLNDATIEDCEDDDEDPNDDHNDLEKQLEENLALLFLKMETILHIPQRSIQEVIEQLVQINALSEPLLHKSVNDILKQHMVDNVMVGQLVTAITNTNAIGRFCGKGGSLSTNKRRETYQNRTFPVVQPVEFIIDRFKKDSAVYVPLNAMLQAMLNKTDIINKALEVPQSLPHEYLTYRDGSHYTKNEMFQGDGFKISLGLYIDDFEVSNPLGTSKKKHKMTAVYWVIANLPSKDRSTLHSIQLALLCKAAHVKEHGYEKVLEPLLKDLKYLEQQGVYVDKLGSFVKGTVLYVAADNLASHSLAGFFESFGVERFCRFCMASKHEIQEKEVCPGSFTPRNTQMYNQQVQAVQQDPTLAKDYGVKKMCVLTESLSHFHAINGYPPDVLHDLLEGVVPVELSLCLSHLISRKFFTLEALNNAIKTFPYSSYDKTDQPQPITPGFQAKGTIGGNAHENWALIRLLPLLIGHKVPEGEDAWEILLLLKDIVELALATNHTVESVDILRYKLSEHRQLLQDTFPQYRLRPKHHFIEHYPDLIMAFGPLSHVWTMRFEGKHKFFKKVIRTAQNYKNVALTMSLKHQKLMAYYLNGSSFFRPALEISKVTTSMITSYPENVQTILGQKVPGLTTVLTVSTAFADGIQYTAGMIVSAGSCSALPDFKQIKEIIVVNSELMFLCSNMTSWYHEHLRCFELCEENRFSVVELKHLNDAFPLSSYRYGDSQIITLRRYIVLKHTT